MATIFATTDFSPISNNSVLYAAGLAQHWGAKLHLFNSYYVPFTFDPSMAVMPVGDLKETAETQMAITVENIKNEYPDLIVEHTVEYGDIKDNLSEAVASVKPELVVVASHGGEDTDALFGSTTLELMRAGLAPVLAVPPTASYVPVHGVGIAINLNDAIAKIPFHLIEKIQNLANTTVHVIHVDKVDERAVVDQSSTLAGLKIKEMGAVLHQTDTAGDVDEKIADFAKEQNFQWLAIVPQHHSFWDSLFHKSHTKEVVKYSLLPVLGLHA